MRKNVITSCLLGLSCTLPVFAGTMGDTQTSSLSPVYMGAYGGYGAFSRNGVSGASSALGRLTLGVNAKQYKNWMFGGEVGVQSGSNHGNFGYVVKPLVDLLFTVKGKLVEESPYFYILKGGIAYRQSSNYFYDVNQVSGEFQGGLGYQLTEHAALTALYQGIYANGNAYSNIPTQQAGLLGIDYRF